MGKTEVKTIACADNVKIQVKENRGMRVHPKWMTKRSRRSGDMISSSVLGEYEHLFLDHFRKREYEDGTIEYISQPYFANGLKYDNIKALVEICENEGIEFDIMPNSDHYPGKTIKFRWRQKGEIPVRTHPENASAKDKDKSTNTNTNTKKGAK